MAAVWQRAHREVVSLTTSSYRAEIGDCCQIDRLEMAIYCLAKNILLCKKSLPPNLEFGRVFDMVTRNRPPPPRTLQASGDDGKRGED